MKLKSYISAFALAALVVPAAAQNLDPTVNVTRTYEGKLLEVDKPAIKMAVPDSVTKFNLDFDYSVLESPYKGGEDFTPYLQDIRPEQASQQPTRLWLKVGAGYSLHPELDFVWAAFNRERFKMNFYGSHKSYYGKYHGITIDNENKLKGAALFSQASADGKWTGYDLDTKAGMNCRYDWDEGTFRFDGHYLGLAAADTLLSRSYNGVDVTARVYSRNNDSKYFYYDVLLNYRYGQQNMKEVNMVPAVNLLGEHRFKADATLGEVFTYEHAFLVDLNVDVAAYASDGPYTNISKLGFTPKYRFTRDRFDIKAGLKFEFLLRPNEVNGVAMNQTKGQIVYPDIDVNFHAIEDYMNIYLRARGGADINSYSSLLERNHWFNANYAAAGIPQLDNSVERVDVKLGLDGNVAHRFTYDFNVGYGNMANVLLEHLAVVNGHLLPVAAYGPRQMVYSNFAFGVDAGPVNVGGRIFWNYSFSRDEDFANGIYAFKPSPLSGNLKVTYNWKNRVIAGATMDATLGKKGRFDFGTGYENVKMPGYVDLGLNCTYVVNRKLAAWLKVGNVACMQIQRTPLYAEYGPNFTLGISLNL